jgi:hypothetical protein
MTAAEWLGILLTPGAAVPAAGISGAGQRACVAQVGRYIPIGTKRDLSNAEAQLSRRKSPITSGIWNLKFGIRNL